MSGVRATGIGSMPGDDAAGAQYAEAVRVVLGELGEQPGLPFVPELPGRGAGAGLTGRALAIVAELGADLQPAGWRLTGGTSAGLDQRRARSLLAQDLDQVEEQAAGFSGSLKAQVAGPWTLAATVERPRGDRIVADHGARRELGQALAEGVGAHVADLRRRLPDVDRLVVQVDEPALPAVLTAQVQTASGFGRHRAVDLPEASATLGWVLDAVRDAGGEPWVHSCAAEVPWREVRLAGAHGLSVDADRLGAADHDALAEALEAGAVVGLGVLPGLDPRPEPAAGQLVERVERWLDLVGLDPAVVGDRLVLTPACGLAGASVAWARRALEFAARAAAELART